MREYTVDVIEVHATYTGSTISYWSVEEAHGFNGTKLALMCRGCRYTTENVPTQRREWFVDVFENSGAVVIVRSTTLVFVSEPSRTGELWGNGGMIVR